MIKILSTLLSLVALVLVVSAAMDVGYWVFFTVPLLLLGIVPVLYVISLRHLRQVERRDKRS